MKMKWIAGLVLMLAAGSAGADDVCLGCHGDSAAAGVPRAAVSMLAESVHAGLDCRECHIIDPALVHRGQREVLCARCHVTEAEAYARSPHMEGRQAGLHDVPACETCHGGHDVLPVGDPGAPTNHINSIGLCTGCHADDATTHQAGLDLPDSVMINAYAHSIHGQALLVRGNQQAPACVDCHGSHSSLATDNPESPLYKTHIAATCGRCHADIAAEYEASVHGAGLAAGALESPTCTNCHGEHSIQGVHDPESRVYATNIPTTCSECHTAAAVVGQFGLKADRIATFNASFHGVGIELGDTTFANCASCHGVHSILPQSDPRSMIHPANIETTCGQCHIGLPASFARASVHTSAEDPETGGSFWVRRFYYIFIPLIILSFVTYRVLEYRRRVRRVH